jgi:toxin ParE1/3/4
VVANGSAGARPDERCLPCAPQAEDDLLDIRSYIARDDVQAATRMLGRFRRKFEMVSRQPLIGEERPDLLPRLRCVVEGRYVIFYRPVAGSVPVEIVRVAHGMRDIRPELF